MTKALLTILAIGSVLTGFTVPAHRESEPKPVNIPSAQSDTIKMYTNSEKRYISCVIEEAKQSHQQVLATLNK